MAPAAGRRSSAATPPVRSRWRGLRGTAAGSPPRLGFVRSCAFLRCRARKYGIAAIGPTAARGPCYRRPALVSHRRCRARLQVFSVSTKPEIAELTAAALGRGLLERRLNAVDITEYFLDRIAQYADRSVFITVTAERARAEAMESAKRHAEGRPRGPLDGVPVAWKDLIDVRGTPTTCGAALHRQRAPADQDAPVVANAALSGMVTIGKTNLTEFAFSGLGLNPHFGTPRNPFDGMRAPGGSSSGSAVAVAAGLVPVAIGTDTGGSIRVPAAFNGLVGYKPSEGHVDKTGIQPLSMTLDTVGPIAKSVGDCVLLDRALRRDLVVVPRAAGLGDLTLVVPTNIVLDHADAGVAANFETALARFARVGVRIDRRPLLVLDRMLEVNQRFGTLPPLEAYYVHRDLVDGPARAQMDRRVVRRIESGRGVAAVNLIAIHEARRALQAELNATLKGAAFLAMPSCAIVAPEVAPLEADDERFMATNSLVLRNTMIGNFFNLPGFALPTGNDPQGLPTSILVSAGSGQDEFLIYYALSLEKTLQS
ncbi:MAG: amidase [Alphaproteobacteria bacterium]|nr:amidase [Alphaproteobacteria bacterium]